MDEESAAKEKPEVDDVSDLEKTCNVYVDDDEVAYDIRMMKVDVKYGRYGENNFYRMQVHFLYLLLFSTRHSPSHQLWK